MVIKGIIKINLFFFENIFAPYWFFYIPLLPQTIGKADALVSRQKI
jgi:hypothetical protein